MWLASFLDKFDLVFVQELVAPPFPGSFPGGEAYKPDREARLFFQEMTQRGFSYWLSEEDTGSGPLIHRNNTGTEWWVAFYRDETVKPAEDLPHGFLQADRSDNPDFERVPFAFPFRFGGQNDYVFISVHLQPGGSGSDAARRLEEISAVLRWIREQPGTEQDYVILGDMNIKDCDELLAVTPPGFRSLNEGCLATNTKSMERKDAGRPYDHVMIPLPPGRGEVCRGNADDVSDFQVVNLVEAVRAERQARGESPPFTYRHGPFRMRYSDHHPVRFKIRIMPDDD